MANKVNKVNKANKVNKVNKLNKVLSQIFCELLGLFFTRSQFVYHSSRTSQSMILLSISGRHVSSKEKTWDKVRHCNYMLEQAAVKYYVRRQSVI